MMDRVEFEARIEHIAFSTDGSFVTLTLSLPDGENERLRIPCEAYAKQIKGKSSLSSEEAAAVKEESDCFEALSTGMRILSYGANTKAEVKKKLFARRYSFSAVERALKTLSANGYIDEKALLRDEVKHCLAKGYGPKKIYARLKGRGFSSTYISAAMKKLETYDFLPACKELAVKKWVIFNSKNADISARRDRLIVSLRNYGYSTECVMRAVEHLIEAFEENEKDE